MKANYNRKANHRKDESTGYTFPVREHFFVTEFESKIEQKMNEDFPPHSEREEPYLTEVFRKILPDLNPEFAAGETESEEEEIEYKGDILADFREGIRSELQSELEAIKAELTAEIADMSGERPVLKYLYADALNRVTAYLKCLPRVNVMSFNDTTGMQIRYFIAHWRKPVPKEPF